MQSGMSIMISAIIGWAVGMACGQSYTLHRLNDSGNFTVGECVREMGDNYTAKITEIRYGAIEVQWHSSRNRDVFVKDNILKLIKIKCPIEE